MVSASTAQPTAEVTPRTCDAELTRAFGFLGKRWTGVLMGTLIQGAAGYAELKRALGISDATLTDRLAELTEAGLVARTVDPGPPVTVSYGLTEDGFALSPALEALVTWARHHLKSEDGK
ncbi:winged helix-turn-helix transcriptional regulator [Klenkia marina]|nr:helix-turn-helix domain-containing protein [Klenkia marina]